MINDIRWVINLGNSICGVSLLVLPYCFSQCGVLLGVILLLFSAVLTKWSCHLLLECVFATKSVSYEAVAKELYGPFGKLMVEISSITLNIGCCSAFFVIVSDLAPGVISWALGTTPIINPSLRIVILTSLGLTVILPLSLVRNLEPLNFISLGSMVFYCILTLQLFFLAVIFAGSDNILNHIHLWDFKGIFNVLPIYALAFSCHLQLLAVTREVVGEIRAEGTSEELSRMKWISRGAVSLVGVVYGSVSLFGHIAFCDSGVRADVLSNFNNSILSQITRCGFAVSVLLSFPFIINPCRATLYSLIYGRTDKYIPTQKHFIITSGIVFIAFFVAVTTPNVALVVALTGAISGAVICYLFPSVSYLIHPKINHTQKQKAKAYVLVSIGVLLLTAGTMSALMTSSSEEGGGIRVKPVEDNPGDIMNILNNKETIPLTDDKVKTGEETLQVDGLKETAGDGGGRGIDPVLIDIGQPVAPLPDNPLIGKVGQVLTGARMLQEDKGKEQEEKQTESETSLNNNNKNGQQQQGEQQGEDSQEEIVDKEVVSHESVGSEEIDIDKKKENEKTEPNRLTPVPNGREDEKDSTTREKPVQTTQREIPVDNTREKSTIIKEEESVHNEEEEQADTKMEPVNELSQPADIGQQPIVKREEPVDDPLETGGEPVNAVKEPAEPVDVVKEPVEPVDAVKEPVKPVDVRDKQSEDEIAISQDEIERTRPNRTVVTTPS